ncbi:FAD/NAD(P)-binding domain-containing protein [Fragilariopsis cylindrus CCMP1102]|uniref:FAD/NAD(P)-binding domain-containing protein n=1 Tax=Fragilariopsis cylindrus CCMP1102 TaxID=635003 RepID=A0A1E7ENS3_9STRA|nr:FAD/NAD(P)-binding domain-containing protein [Fragilariopsis cylindrus CCMP1102]|eukprot:OEU07619.1 FAD/NAD(P)-binding domain-containing protein [Fragilariopsis cylindrus CCMP1102]
MKSRWNESRDTSICATNSNSNIRPFCCCCCCCCIKKCILVEINYLFGGNRSRGTKSVLIIGAGWGGLSTAHALSSQTDIPLDITVIDSATKVGGLVRDGYQTMNGIVNKAEAGQHGFWDNYSNIFSLLDNELPTTTDDILTGYAEQGQYSPNGLEAIWPVYRQQSPQLPTGLAQGLYTKFQNLPLLDRISAASLVVAFSEFDDSPEAWAKYDNVSFQDLCIKLGVTRKCYQEAFEPMILTGLFSPGAECSAAAALGMAYFFVLKSQNSFDVRWCKGNIGEKIFQPWVQHLENNHANENNNNDNNNDNNNNSNARQSVNFMTSTRVIGFENENDVDTITKVICKKTDDDNSDNNKDDEDNIISIESDIVVFAVGGSALNGFVRNSPKVLAKHTEFRRFANLRGTGVLATRIYLDNYLDIPYSANACWGFDKGVGMTFFDITTLHGLKQQKQQDGIGSIIEVDYYHAASLLVMSDEAIVSKVKKDLNTILGTQCIDATIVDAAIVRLPQAVNWYSPGSYANMPDVQSKAIPNVYFAGDLVRTRHGSWSQEKAYVSGIEAANSILNRSPEYGIIPLEPDELHVSLGVGVHNSMFKISKREPSGCALLKEGDPNVIQGLLEPWSKSD